jgi:hypothetical protein
MAMAIIRKMLKQRAFYWVKQGENQVPVGRRRGGVP